MEQDINNCYSNYYSNYYSNCRLCPNECGVDRTSGQLGVCGQSNEMQIAWVGLHRGEEPPITGEHGSGMVFFCGCPLHCQYCQNYQISHAFKASGVGRESYEGITVSIEQLASLMLQLQAFGAASINLVTGTHYIPSIVKALQIAKNNGLKLPIVWNSSGYESVEAIKLIDPYIDLYLLDVKTLDSKVAAKFCGLARYSTAVIPLVKFLKRRYPVTDLEKSLTGVLVRHLVFPGTMAATMNFLSWFADNFKDNFLLSLMVQFVPPFNDPGFPKITAEEYEQLLEALDRYEIDGFVQETSDNEILWIPDFTKDQPFPEGFADPLPEFLELKYSLN
jgi:putative pyruvate formate lyase activating enzyme